MNPFLKSLLILLAPLASLVHAETEDEFIARITAAWESKDPEKVLALYGESENQSTKYKGSRLEMELRTLRLKSVQLIPFLPDNGSTTIDEGRIFFMPEASKSVSLELTNEESKSQHSITKVSPLVKNKDGGLSLGSPAVRNFDWSGDKLVQFQIHVSPQPSASISPIIVVAESCDRIFWKTMNHVSFSFSAHKILQLVIPPADGVETVTIKIAKNDAEPFFKKTIDSSKGAIIPIEVPTP